jgi:lysophospholipase
MIRLCLCLLLTWSLAAQAVSESDYELKMKEEVLPFFAKGEQGQLTSFDGKKLQYHYFQHPNAHSNLIIATGWTEGAPKYAELIYDLHQAGVETFIMDWRGQGLSERLIQDTQVTWVADYGDFVKDLHQFVTEVVKPRARLPLTIMGHSMGANVTTLYMTQHPEVFDRAVLSSPMLDMILGPYPTWVGRAISWFYNAVGFGTSMVWGHSYFDPSKSENWVTHSKSRWNFWNQYKVDHPQYVLNAASFRWVLEGLKATDYMKEKAQLIQVPLLMLQAGRDLYVATEGQDRVCEKAYYCKKITYPFAKHEILNEVDLIRQDAVDEIVRFLRRDLKVPDELKYNSAAAK